MIPPEALPNRERPRYTFIHGPKIASISKDDGRTIRSDLMRRVFREKQRPSKPRYSPNSSEWVCICQARPSGGSASTFSQDREQLRKLLPGPERPAPGEEEACRVCHGRLRIRRALKSNENLMTMLGSGRVDPFAASRGSLGGPEYDQLADYCAQVLWPTFRSIDDYPRQFYQTWINESVGSPLVLHSFIFAASHHQRTLLSTSGVGQGSQAPSDCLYHKGQALKLVRELIAHPEQRYDLDDLVCAILYLAVNENVPMTPCLRDPSPFIPPLPNAHWLDMYTGREFDITHWSAVQLILRQHGGIEELTKYGLAWLVSFGGIMIATATLTRPIYPLFDPDGNHFAYRPPLQYLGIAETVAQVAPTTGFHQLRSLGIKRSLVRAFLDLTELTQAMELYTGDDGKCNPSDIDIFGDCRNLVQHRLLSTPESSAPLHLIFRDEDSSSRQNLPLYLACRYAALLFAIHVTFPIARSKATRMMLLRLLKEELENADLWSDEHIVPGLLLWCIMIGGIAAEHSTAREWFVAQLRNISIPLGNPTWEDMRVHMQLFAWVGTACDGGGYSFWSEVHPEEIAQSRGRRSIEKRKTSPPYF